MNETTVENSAATERPFVPEVVRSTSDRSKAEPSSVRSLARPGAGRRRRAPGKPIFENEIGKTRCTWICRKLAEGSSGRREVNRYVMSVYYEPLQSYLRGCGLRWLADRVGNAQDIVHGFFLSRLGRDEFFTDWQKSGRRLRDFIVGAFWHYLYEVRRELHSRQARQVLVKDLDRWSAPDDHIREFRRSVAFSIVQGALERTKISLEARHMGMHWQVLVKRFYDGLRYREIGKVLGISEARARKMAQTARRNFTSILAETMTTDVNDRREAREGIRLLLEVLNV